MRFLLGSNKHRRFSLPTTSIGIATCADARLPQEEESSKWSLGPLLGGAWYELLQVVLRLPSLRVLFPYVYTNTSILVLDILHGDINYFTENPIMGPQMSRMRGHFSLEGATYEAKLGKHGLPKLVFHRKSGIPYVPFRVLAVRDASMVATLT